MDKQDCILLFHRLYPDFFEQASIRNMPEEFIFDEMILPLKEFDACKYDKDLADHISFGFYEGDLDTLKKIVEQVDPQWVPYYSAGQRIYCGYIDGQVASFCIIRDMGSYNINGRDIKIGGLGCVGTLSEYRDRGIGLTMVKHATQILKDEGYAYSYIHFTYVAAWYEKLGYRTAVKWNKNGVL